MKNNKCHEGPGGEFPSSSLVCSIVAGGLVRGTAMRAGARISCSPPSAFRRRIRWRVRAATPSSLLMPPLLSKGVFLAHPWEVRPGSGSGEVTEGAPIIGGATPRIVNIAPRIIGVLLCFQFASYMINNQKEALQEKPKSTPTIIVIVIVAHSKSFSIRPKTTGHKWWNGA